MSLAMRIYTTFAIAVLLVCMALVVAMIVDSQLGPNGAGAVLSDVDAGVRGD
jgi:hypothetical protein